jgi:hypothetical protein
VIDGYWLPSYRSDPRAISLYLRHYSAKKNHRPGRRLRNFVGPGEPMVLLTADCAAAFCWLWNTVERWEGRRTPPRSAGSRPWLRDGEGRMAERSTVDILRAARHRIESPRRWCQGAFAARGA